VKFYLRQLRYERLDRFHTADANSDFSRSSNFLH